MKAAFLLFLSLVPLAPSALPCTGSELTREPFSGSNPAEVAVTHTHMDLAISFDTRVVSGSVVLRLSNPSGSPRLDLDTRDLEILGVRARGRNLGFTLGPDHPLLGRKLSIPLSPGIDSVTIAYRTSPSSPALQWVEPSATASGKPMLYAQSSPLLARAWFPCQDTPAARMTYSAELRVPSGMMALMSARNPRALDPGGVYRFSMPETVPTYLVAFAVGEFAFQALSAETGIYAEPGFLPRAVAEFRELPALFARAQDQFGPYRWERYDLLFLAPSFPYGGMENPRLTFLSPSLVTGDRSLFTWVAHEFGHSWAGNLVTNRSWNHFWLNEGINTYLELRLIEAMQGAEAAQIVATVYVRGLEADLRRLGPQSPYARLVWPLAAESDPNDAINEVPYIKGYLFMRMLEEAYGRPAIDAFLKKYFETFAFRSITTTDFLALLRREVMTARPSVREASLHLDAWLHDFAFPPNRPVVQSPLLEEAERSAHDFARGGLTLTRDRLRRWSAWERVYFLQSLTGPIAADRMAEVGDALAIRSEGNPEVLTAWFELAVRSGYRPAYPAMESYLVGLGRPRNLRPVYQALASRPGALGIEFARRVFARARAGYHSRTQEMIGRILR